MPHVAARRALTCVALACAALAAQGAMYKWVDEKGVTHYSENPPPDGKAKMLELPRSAPSGEAPKAPNWTERELEYRKRRLEREHAEEDAKAASDRRSEQRRRQCLQAQENLDVLKAAVPVYKVNERGERVYLEDAERTAEIRKWRERADESCR